MLVAAACQGDWLVLANCMTGTQGTDTDYGDDTIFVGTPMPMNFKLRPAVQQKPFDADANAKPESLTPQQPEDKSPEGTLGDDNSQSRTSQMESNDPGRRFVQSRRGPGAWRIRQSSGGTAASRPSCVANAT